MSREFHWTSSSYMHSVLSEVEDAREITGEPVADAIREILIALAPIEFAVASEQASDSSHSRVVIACHEHKDKLLAAMETLRRAVLSNSEIVSDVIREGLKS